jgi:hypothetical protein
MTYDRNEVLGRTDLGELADQLVGPHKGRGSGATWPCPDPGHGNQTGKTPPVSIFRTGYGDERWRCHSCGAGGTAIDLVMTTQGVRFPEAIELLARRAGVAAVDRPMAALRTARIQRPEPAAPARPSPEVERFVAAAEGYLWSEKGRPMQRWLAERGLGEEVLRANRVGADPGPTGLDRARGLPRGGPAVVLPVLGPDGQAAYLQSRYLSPRRHKYDNPSAALAGALPRVAEVRLPRPADDPGLVVVSEGIPDALVAAQAGYRAVAVLGAGVPDERAAAALVGRFPTERLVVAFDADAAGQAGAERLAELLSERGAGQRVARLEVPVSAGDLNGWQQAAGANFGDEFARAMTGATTGSERSMATEPSRPRVDQVAPQRPSPGIPRGPEQAFAARGETLQDRLLVTTQTPASRGGYVTATRSGVEVPSASPSLKRSLAGDPVSTLLEDIYRRHVAVEAVPAANNMVRIHEAVASWADPGLVHPTAGLDRAPEMAGLDDRLTKLHGHFLGSDPAAANAAARDYLASIRGSHNGRADPGGAQGPAELRSVVGHWSAEVSEALSGPAQLDSAAHQGLRGSVESAARRESAEWAKPDLIDRLETILYHHVLVDDPRMARENLARVEQAVDSWTMGITARTQGDEWSEGSLAHASSEVLAINHQPPAYGRDESWEHLGPTPSMAELDQRLEQLAYRHVLVDDPYLAQLNLDTTATITRGWSQITTAADLAPVAGADGDLVAAQRWAFDHGLSSTPDPTLTAPELEPPALDGLAIDI